MKTAIQVTVRDYFPWRPDEANLRRIVSLRDGVLEYEGTELGQPAGLVRVYRSPATIANVATEMMGCPVTDGHVDQSRVIPQDTLLGSVREAKAIDLDDPNTKARLAVENLVEVMEDRADRWQQYRDQGREFSLGYGATLVPAPDGADYDYEQRDIVPHHLAVVEAGRCGPACTFLDARTVAPDAATAAKEDGMQKVHKAFADAAGEYSIQKIMEIVAALPEALKTVPMAQLAKAAPQLEALIAAAKVGLPEPAKAEAEAEAPAGDAAPNATGGSMPMPEEQQKVADAKAVAKAVADAVSEAVAVIERARLFVSDEYKFTGKTPAAVMRDVLAQERPGVTFADAEVPVAFKLLVPAPKAKANPYKNFGDSAPNSIAEWIRGDQPNNKEN